MSWIAVKVVKRTVEAEDIVSFELVAADNVTLAPFNAGAHIDVRIDGRITRQYSLCGSLSEPQSYVIAVLKDPHSRGGSIAMHDSVRVGDMLEISMPKNHFPLVGSPHTLLLAGGIGVTPILCMAERLSLIDAGFEMHYCTRSRERTAFHERIVRSPYASRVAFHFDDGSIEQKLDLPRVLKDAPSNTHLYVCGPGGFIDYVKACARDLDWSRDRVHFEYFGVASDALANGEQFDIRIASTGGCYTVARDRTVLQVLHDAGIAVAASCEQGVCGTCITRVLEGVPDHRDQYLTDEERATNDQFTPCCSRSRTPVLVLDL